MTFKTISTTQASLITLLSAMTICASPGISCFSKHWDEDHPEYVALHAATFDERVDGYQRWLLRESNLDIEERIASELHDYCVSVGELEAGTRVFAELTLGDVHFSPIFDTKFTSLLIMHIKANVDPHYVLNQNQISTKGLSLQYKKMFNLMKHDMIISSAIARQGYLGLRNVGAHGEAKKLLKYLYDENPNSPYIAEAYIKDNFGWLLKNGKIDKLQEALNTAECLEKAQDSPHFHNIRGLVYAQQGMFDKALASFRIVCSIDTDLSVHRKNLASCLLLNKLFEEAIPHYYAVLNAGDYDDGNLVYELVQALKSAGREEEAAQLLSERVLAPLAQKIKQRNESPAQQPSTPAESRTPSTKPQSRPAPRNRTCTQSTSEPAEAFTSSEPKQYNLKREYRGKETVEKPKRKGTADPSRAKTGNVTTTTTTMLTPAPTITVESLLGRTSHHYEIFCRFFENLEGETKIKSLNISMHDTKLLLGTLGTFDPSGGKGSHAKTTLSAPKPAESDDDPMQQIMITLAKKSTLLPYQILQIRNAFLEMGLYPEDLKELLIRKELL